MYEDIFTLPVDDVSEIKQLLEQEGPHSVSINEESYIVLSIDEENNELELQYIDEPVTYH